MADDIEALVTRLVAERAQLFAAALTVQKGMDAERPRGLNKVTLTR